MPPSRPYAHIHSADQNDRSNLACRNHLWIDLLTRKLSASDQSWSSLYPRPRLNDLTFAMKSRTIGSIIPFFSVIIQCFCFTIKFGEQSLCVLEILRIKALGEAAIDRAKQIECFGMLALVHQEPGKVYPGTELKRPRVLPARCFHSLVEQSCYLGVRRAAREQRASL